MTITVTPNGQACGATVTGVNLIAPLPRASVAETHAARLEQHIYSSSPSNR